MSPDTSRVGYGKMPQPHLLTNPKLDTQGRSCFSLSARFMQVYPLCCLWELMQRCHQCMLHSPLEGRPTYSQLPAIAIPSLLWYRTMQQSHRATEKAFKGVLAVVFSAE